VSQEKLTKWITDDREKVEQALRLAEEKQRFPPTLSFEEMKLYKLEVIEPVHTVETTFGSRSVMRVRNLADNREYTVFTPTVLRSKLEALKIEEGSIIGVVNKGREKGKRYLDFAVFLWDKDFDELIR